MTEAQFEIALKNMRQQTAFNCQKTILKNLKRNYKELKQARRDPHKWDETLLETQRLYEQLRINIASLLRNQQ